MDRGDILLQQLLAKLKANWLNVISRSTHTEVIVVVVPQDGFILRATWPNGGAYERHFSKRHCFGNSFRLTSAAWRLERKTCDYARDFLREVLEQRGV